MERTRENLRPDPETKIGFNMTGLNYEADDTKDVGIGLSSLASSIVVTVREMTIRAITEKFQCSLDTAEQTLKRLLNGSYINTVATEMGMSFENLDSLE